MPCKACGADVPLVDNCCPDCCNEGPFTRADRLTRWERRFAWLPVRVEFKPTQYKRVWLRPFEERVMHVFGRGEVQRRAA